MVSAWAGKNSMVLGQVKVEQKSNEITAIPELLDLIAIEGCIVTIDAMGCQEGIAKKIIDGGADYVLAVKRNNRNLYKGLAMKTKFGWIFLILYYINNYIIHIIDTLSIFS